MEWKNRHSLIMDELESVDCDVICLQEVEVATYEENFKIPLGERGYEGVLQETNGHVVGVATFFKRSKFSLTFSESRSRALLIGLTFFLPLNLESESLSLEGTDEEEMTKIQMQIGNVHLEGHISESVKRFSQIKSLLKRCEVRLNGGKNPNQNRKQKQNQKNQTEEPIEKLEDLLFICGDFNGSNSSGVHHLLQKGFLHPEFQENEAQVTETTFTHPFKLMDTHLEFEKENKEETFSYCRDYLCDKIDFIFAPATQMKTLGILCMKKLEAANIKSTYLPNHFHPSDHLPVAALLEFTPGFIEFIKRKNVVES